MRVELSDQARRDLRDISRFGVKVWDPTQAAAYITALRASIAQLEQFPELGSVHRLNDSGEIRRLVHRRHVVFYQPSGETIVILRVLSVRAALPDSPEMGGLSDDV